MNKLVNSGHIALLLGVALTLCSAVVGAQPVVEAHLQRGVELRRAGRDAEAVVEFESAYRIAPTARTAGQLGLAMQASGDWVRGYEMVREALATPSDAWVSRNRVALQQAISAAEQHVGLLDLRGDSVGARVFLDGHSLGSLPMAREQPILAGRHTLELRMDNFEPVSREIVVRPGELNREVVNRSDFRPVSAGGTSGSTSSALSASTAVNLNDTSGSARSWPWFGVGLATGGVGIAALVVGGILDGLALSAAGDYNGPRAAGEPPCPSAPPRPPPSNVVCTALFDRYTTFNTAGIGLLVGGGVLLVGGIVFVALPRPSAVRVALRPTVGGIFIDGSF